MLYVGLCKNYRSAYTDELCGAGLTGHNTLEEPFENFVCGKPGCEKYDPLTKAEFENILNEIYLLVKYS